MRGCEDLMKNGHSESKVYNIDGGDGGETAEVSSAVAAGESYSARLCEQSSAGGGWTVTKTNPMLPFVLLLLCVEMCLLRWVHESVL